MNDINNKQLSPFLMNKTLQDSNRELNPVKYDVNESPNDFTDGYYIRFSEIIIIAAIIVFWLLALRKFTKNFDKIRTTHYREIPYKYKIKDVENLKSVNVTHAAKDGVIFTRDPINNLIHQSKLCPYDIFSNAETTPVSNASINQVRGDINEISSRNYANRKQLFSCKKSTIDNNSSNDYSICNEHYQNSHSHSLINLKRFNLVRTKQCQRQDDSILNDNIYRSTRDKVNMKRSSILTNDSTKQQSLNNLTELNEANHPLMMSSFIRRSFIDLHRQTRQNRARGNSERNSTIDTN